MQVLLRQQHVASESQIWCQGRSVVQGWPDSDANSESSSLSEAWSLESHVTSGTLKANIFNLKGKLQICSFLFYKPHKVLGSSVILLIQLVICYCFSFRLMFIYHINHQRQWCTDANVKYWAASQQKSRAQSKDYSRTATWYLKPQEHQTCFHLTAHHWFDHCSKSVFSNTKIAM